MNIAPLVIAPDEAWEPLVSALQAQLQALAARLDAGNVAALLPAPAVWLLEKPGTDLLAGLSLAQWLNNDPEAAIATYRQLIETGRTAKPPKDWADAKTITAQKWPEAETKPMEALRGVTVKKYPELVPKPEDKTK